MRTFLLGLALVAVMPLAMAAEPDAAALIEKKAAFVAELEATAIELEAGSDDDKDRAAVIRAQLERLRENLRTLRSEASNNGQ